MEELSIKLVCLQVAGGNNREVKAILEEGKT